MRNLAILRHTPGVVVLLEGPCMSNARECQRLHASDAASDVVIDGRRYPARVCQYADTVIEGLKAGPGSRD